jgi:glyoxalase/bleomycin resistance protein/dioxygenase superfamily protein
MKRMVILTFAASMMAAGPALAQRMPFNEAGITMGHWHMNSQNVEANKKLFAAMGGKTTKPGDFEIVNFPGVSIFLHQRPLTPPPTGGTAGSVINHVSLSVPNVQAADIPGANLTFTKSDTPTVPTRGRVLDHIGFDVKDLEAFAKKLQETGVKLDRQVERRPDGSAIAFTRDEWGTSIELNERPNPL